MSSQSVVSNYGPSKPANAGSEDDSFIGFGVELVGTFQMRFRLLVFILSVLFLEFFLASCGEKCDKECEGIEDCQANFGENYVCKCRVN